MVRDPMRNMKDMNNVSFSYGIAKVKDLVAGAIQVPGDKNRTPKSIVNTLSIDGQPFTPSKRFWTSIQCRFGFSHNVFRYFDHKEVFDRISERAPNDKIKYCVEHRGDDHTLLAVTNPSSPAIRNDQLQELLAQYGTEKLGYANGIVRSTHNPRGAAAKFTISGDEFQNQFVLDTPIDGFGRPSVYLSLLRLICTNGAIGFTKAFRSELQGGKNDQECAFAIIRAIDGFNNEEGFAAMRDRFAEATKSWASVNEVQKLYKILAGLASTKDLALQGRTTDTNTGEVVESASPVFHNFHKMTGDLAQVYGMTNLDTLSVKRQRTLPAPCKVYDLLNFATEVATHHTKAKGDRKLQAFVGEMVANEYDLEGTVDQFSDWQDFFIGDEQAIETMAAMKTKR